MNEIAKVEMGDALAKAELRSGGSVGAIVPQDAEQAYRMAQLIAKSGMAPTGMKEPEKIVTAIFHGLEVGLKPLQAVQSIAVVNGRPCIWGDAALGLVMGSGLLDDILEFIDGEDDAMTAVCRVQRKGMKSGTERKFGVADAKKASLWGKTGPWTQYPKRMLQMRARAFALRDGFADVLKGLHVYEEVRDYARPVPADVSGPVTGQAIIDQAAHEPAADDAEPDVKEEKISETQQNAESPTEPEAPAEPDGRPVSPDETEPAAEPTPDSGPNLRVPLLLNADSEDPDWIAWYDAVKRVAMSAAPADMNLLREANEDNFERMRKASASNYRSLMKVIDDREAEPA